MLVDDQLEALEAFLSLLWQSNSSRIYSLDFKKEQIHNNKIIVTDM